MGTLRIKRMTNQDEKFYPTIGPYLSRRTVVAELGAPVWDDDGKEWFVAYVGRKVAGFAATRKVGGHMSLVSAYVLPEFRRNGVYTALVDARLVATGDAPIKAVATQNAAALLRKRGINETGSRGKFTVMGRK